MLDLSIKEHREQLANRIKNDIDEFCIKRHHEGHRKHLGASIMGHACDRYLWATFRWLKDQKHSGRMYRLFNVGHKAEPRFIEYLRGIGFEVLEINPDTGKQWRISAHNGHYGGSLDGLCKAPKHYELSEDLVFLNEFKTNGTGAGFTSVGAQGVEKAKPQHFKQMSQYGYKYNLKYGLYIIENKNDSELCPQIVELDWQLGAQMELRAGDIINAKEPPPKIAENSSYFECKYCHFSGICFENEPVQKNCRSCKMSSPVENGQWFCSRWNSIIPENEIINGCGDHISII